MTTGPGMVATRFLGVAITGGVAPRMRDALGRVEDHLRDEYAREMLALPADALRPTWEAWHGIRQVGGWREHGGHHTEGVAVDLNPSTNGYAVCATATARGIVYGGEAAGAKLPGVRKAFILACGRACVAAGVLCDLSARRKGESTGSVWDRWHVVSEAVRAYFAPWYGTHDAIDKGAADVLPGVVVPAQVAADYEAIRTPLVVGAPSLHPAVTRNPARCLMDIPRAVAVAMCDVGGMRWGACDFGAAESSDLMHYDLASRIPSGAL